MTPSSQAGHPHNVPEAARLVLEPAVGVVPLDCLVVCVGPGDHGEPVVTIMLPSDD